MKALHRKFIIQLLVISIVLYGALYLIYSTQHIATQPILVIVALLFAINALAFIVVTNTKEKKPGGFVYSYMAVSLGRIIICTVFVFSYVLTHKQDAKIFAVTFFILYFLYTIVEVKALYTFFKA